MDLKGLSLSHEFASLIYSYNINPPSGFHKGGKPNIRISDLYSAADVPNLIAIQAESQASLGLGHESSSH